MRLWRGRNRISPCRSQPEGAATRGAHLPRTRLSELTGRRRAQMLRRKTRLVEGEARDEGSSAELSDMQRRGSSDARRDTSQGEEVYPPTKHCGAYRREDDGSGGAGSGSEAETPSTAPNSRGCQARPRSGPQRGGTRENETSRAGLDPDGVYVYAEWVEGRANRPFLAGEHRCPDRGRTLEGKPARDNTGQTASTIAEPPPKLPRHRLAGKKIDRGRCAAAGFSSVVTAVSRPSGGPCLP